MLRVNCRLNLIHLNFGIYLNQLFACSVPEVSIGQRESKDRRISREKFKEKPQSYPQTHHFSRRFKARSLTYVIARNVGRDKAFIQDLFFKRIDSQLFEVGATFEVPAGKKVKIITEVYGFKK